MSEPDHNNPNHPGPGWHPVLRGGPLKGGDIFYRHGRWEATEEAGEVAYFTHFRLYEKESLSSEEQAVIDAMRSGRRVTVEPEPPKPVNPRRCQIFCERGEQEDPWAGAWPLHPEAHNITANEDYELVQMIELTPEVIAALAAAGIEYEDSAIQKGAEQ